MKSGCSLKLLTDQKLMTKSKRIGATKHDGHDAEGRREEQRVRRAFIAAPVDDPLVGSIPAETYWVSPS